MGGNQAPAGTHPLEPRPQWREAAEGPCAQSRGPSFGFSKHPAGWLTPPPNFPCPADPDAAPEDPGAGGGRRRPGARRAESAAHVPDHGGGLRAAAAHVLAHLPPGALRTGRPRPLVRPRPLDRSGHAPTSQPIVWPRPCAVRPRPQARRPAQYQ